MKHTTDAGVSPNRAARRDTVRGQGHRPEAVCHPTNQPLYKENAMRITLSDVHRLTVALLLGLCLTGYAGSGARAYAQPLETEVFLLQNFSGQCLDVANGSTAAGAAVNVFPCHGGPAQQWHLEDPYAGTQLARHRHRQLVNEHSGMCLTTQNGRQHGASHTQEICRVYGFGQNLDPQLFRLDFASGSNPAWYWLAGKYGRGCAYDNPQDGSNAVVWYQSTQGCPADFRYYWHLVPVNP